MLKDTRYFDATNIIFSEPDIFFSSERSNKIVAKNLYIFFLRVSPFSPPPLRIHSLTPRADFIITCHREFLFCIFFSEVCNYYSSSVQLFIRARISRKYAWLWFQAALRSPSPILTQNSMASTPLTLSFPRGCIANLQYHIPDSGTISQGVDVI